MRKRRLWFISWKKFLACSLLPTVCTAVLAQQTASDSEAKEFAASVQELREQVQELRTTVAEMKSEASRYREETEQLRKELERLQAASAAPVAAKPVEPATAEPSALQPSLDQRVASIEETTQMIQSELRDQYQTKVESGSKYRARISGLAVFNLFNNRGAVDNLDFPTYATPGSTYGSRASFGATLRQSQLGLEVFGPSIAGAKTSGQVQFDFSGGFPSAELNGVNTGLLRMRTASMRLDWQHTSIVVGQDDLFISPGSPTSYASLAVPSLGYSGNLWSWTPQVRIEHKIDLTEKQNFLVQAGVLDNLTGEPSVGSHRRSQAGESSGQPAFALRTSWNAIVFGRPLALGASGYYSREDWGPGWNVDGWAGVMDWKLPLMARLELSGEFYRGRGIGGIGGGIGQSVLFSTNPLTTGPFFRALNATGGWSQLKILATPKLEFNGAFGVDNPFASDIRAVSYPISYYATVLTSNRSEMMNFIFRPRSDLLFSGEYRHLRTSQIGPLGAADQVNLVMGVLF